MRNVDGAVRSPRLRLQRSRQSILTVDYTMPGMDFSSRPLHTLDRHRFAPCTASSSSIHLANAAGSLPPEYMTANRSLFLSAKLSFPLFISERRAKHLGRQIL